MFRKLISIVKGALRLNKSRKSLVNSSIRKELSSKGKEASRRRQKERSRLDSVPARKEQGRKNSPKNANSSKPKKTPQMKQAKKTFSPPKALPMPELIEIEPVEGKKRFCDFPLAPEILAGTQQLGFKYCSVIQEKAIPYALEGKDLAAKAQTGTGKTAAFLTAAMTRLLRNPKPERKPGSCRVLVLEPTRELALQIEKDANELGKYTGLYCKAIFGGMDYKEQRDSIRDHVDILAGTPGRILDYASGGYLDLSETEVLRTDFIANVSHEIKTPLAIIQNYASALGARDIPFEERKEYAETVSSSAKRLSALISNILKLNKLEHQTDRLDFLFQSLVKMSRLETGVIQIRKERGDLFDTLAGAMAAVVPAASKKSIALEVEGGGEKLSGETDKNRLLLSHDRKWTEEAVYNLLDNAVKYTPEGGRVTLCVEKKEIFTEIHVRDTGKGIALERQAQIFTRFYREPEVQDLEGLGIGLYLTRKIAELQGGYVEVRSEAGKGADFCLFLPNAGTLTVS